MIDHGAYKLAARARARTLSVCTTGSISMSASVVGYVRTSGSFVTDGFQVGMELSALAFSKSANNGSHFVTAVSALLLSVSGGLTAESSAAARSLAVGLPTGRSFENVGFEPTSGETHVDEQYDPGPSPQVTLGVGGEIELTPIYYMAFNVPKGTGEAAASAYQKAFLALFAPRTAIAAANGDVLRVRTDSGPTPGQLLPRENGFARTSISVPLWTRTFNST